MKERKWTGINYYLRILIDDILEKYGKTEMDRYYQRILIDDILEKYGGMEIDRFNLRIHIDHILFCSRAHCFCYNWHIEKQGQQP